MTILDRLRCVAAATAVLVSPSMARGQVLPLDVQKLSDGVFAVVRPTDADAPSDSNTLVVIGDDGVLVVDSNITPASSEAVIDEIRKLTSLPVRFLVNTHHHSDHIYGNATYERAFPGVVLIGHERMREDFIGANPKGREEFLREARTVLAEGPARLASGRNAKGEPMSGAERKALADSIGVYRIYLPELERAVLRPPVVTVRDRMTIHLGAREVQLLHLGRGNTRGDLVVYLPAEKVVALGDLLVYPIPFAYESFIGDWSQTMQRVLALEADIILPGHGPVQRDNRYARLVAGILAAATKETREAVARGLSKEEVLRTVTLDAFRLQFAGTDATLDTAFRRGLVPFLVRQAYAEAVAGK